MSSRLFPLLSSSTNLSFSPQTPHPFPLSALCSWSWWRQRETMWGTWAQWWRYASRHTPQHTLLPPRKQRNTQHNAAQHILHNSHAAQQPCTQWNTTYYEAHHSYLRVLGLVPSGVSKDQRITHYLNLACHITVHLYCMYHACKLVTVTKPWGKAYEEMSHLIHVHGVTPRHSLLHCYTIWQSTL